MSTDLQVLQARYHEAFDAHHRLVTRNVDIAMSGSAPSDQQIAEEFAALGALESARRAMLVALSIPDR